MDNSEGNKRIAKNTFFLYFRMIFVLLVSLYTTRVILNSLGVIDYGIYNVVAGFVSMFSFLNNSLSNGIQRFYNIQLGKNEEGGISKVYTTALLIQIALAIILTLLLEIIGIWYLENKMVIPLDRLAAAKWVMHLSIFSLSFVIIEIPFSAAVMAYEKMNYYALVSIVDVLLKLGIAIILPWISYDKLIIYGFFMFGVHFLNFLLYFLYSKKNFKDLRLTRERNPKLMGNLLSFSGWNVFGTFAYMIKDQGLNVLINAFFGPVVNAAKGVSGQIQSALHGFSSNIVTAVRPQLVQSYAAGDTTRVKNLMFSLSKLTFVMLYILSLPIILELDYVLHLWLGEAVPEYTKQFTILILLIMIVTSMNTPLSQVVHATGKMRTYQVTTSLVICMILPISWIFLKMGCAPSSVFVVSLVVSIFNQVVCLFVLKRIFEFSIREYCMSIVLPALVVFCLSPILPFFLTQKLETSFFRLTIVSVTSMLLVTSLSYLLIFNKAERELTKSIILKFKKSSV